MIRKKRATKILLTVATAFILIAGIVYSQSEGPSNLQAMANGSNITLTWSAPSSGAATSYNIYKASAGETADTSDYSKLDFSKINSTTTTAYQDSLGSMGGGTFVYYVTAVGSDGTESSPSNYAKVTVGQ